MRLAATLLCTAVSLALGACGVKGPLVPAKREAPAAPASTTPPTTAPQTTVPPIPPATIQGNPERKP